MRTRNLDEGIDAVSRVHCPHPIEIVGPARNINAVLEVGHAISQPLVGLSCSTAVVGQCAKPSTMTAGRSAEAARTGNNRIWSSTVGRRL